MRLGICSDLHIDFYNKAQLDSLKEKLDKEINYLIVAGDVCNDILENLPLVNKFFGELAKKVIYVPGNHDLWGSGFEHFEQNKHKLLFLHVLDNNGIEIDGVKFYGGALWFKFLNDPMLNLLQKWPDFVYIPDWQEIDKSRERFIANAAKADIVISHHIPSYQLVHPMWQGERSNMFFANHLDSLIRDIAPKYWIYGHTHTKMIKPYDEVTMTIVNPHGYPGENSKNYNLEIIEV